MNILSGLTAKQIGAIRHCSCHREFAPGDVIFQEGTPAYGIFVIISGKVEIYRTTDRGEIKLNELGPDELFGEMGLISETAARSASARAVEQSLIFEIQNNPIEMFKELDEIGGAIALMKNLICILGKWLRQKDRPDAVQVTGTSMVQLPEGYETDARAATEVVKNLLPVGFFKRFPQTVKLQPGQYLCRQGEPPDGFYFVHSGLLEVVKEDQGGRSIDYLGAPTVVGELGYFSGESRSVSLRVAEETTYTPFSGADFKKLEKKQPEDAFELLFAAAQLIVQLIYEREGAMR